MAKYRIKLLGCMPTGVRFPLFAHCRFTLDGDAPRRLVVRAEGSEYYSFKFHQLSNGNHEYRWDGDGRYSPPQMYFWLYHINGYEIYVMDKMKAEATPSYTIQLRGGGVAVPDRDIVIKEKPVVSAKPVVVLDAEGKRLHVFRFHRSTADTYTYNYWHEQAYCLLLDAGSLPEPLPYVVRIVDEVGENSYDFSHTTNMPHPVIAIIVEGVEHRFERIQENGHILLYRRMA